MHLGVGYNFKGLSYWWQEEQLCQLTLSSASLLLLHFNVASSGMRWVPTFPLLALHVNVKFAVPEWKKMLNFGYDQWSNMLTVSEEIFHYLLQDKNHYFETDIVLRICKYLDQDFWVLQKLYWYIYMLIVHKLTVTKFASVIK